MCMIFISTLSADRVWEEIQEYNERECEEDEKSERNKTGAVRLASEDCECFLSPGHLRYGRP